MNSLIPKLSSEYFNGDAIPKEFFKDLWLYVHNRPRSYDSKVNLLIKLKREETL